MTITINQLKRACEELSGELLIEARTAQSVEMFRSSYFHSIANSPELLTRLTNKINGETPDE